MSQNTARRSSILEGIQRFRHPERREGVLSDSELVERVRRGDLESFDALCRRYERTVLAVALARLRDIHAAEDVAQATLLVAFQRLSTLTDPSKFGPWIIKIARRQAIGWRRQRQTTAAVREEGVPEIAACDVTATDWIEKAHMLELIDRLPDRERVLIGLRFFDGHSLTEIAQITGRPLGTVTKQLSRATVRLRSALERENRQ
jgi:RNA polymerase sigma-70 factor, ECF subfamily